MTILITKSPYAHAESKKINPGRFAVISGVGYAENYNTYTIIKWLPMSDFHKSGFKVTLWNKVIGKKQTQSNIQLGANLGYRFVYPNYKWAIALGPAWSQKIITPNKPTESYTLQKKTHIDIHLSAETKINQKWHIFGDAQYNAAIKEGWIQLKPNYMINSGIQIGAITQIKQGYGDTNHQYQEWSVGAFVSNIKIPWFFKNQMLQIGGEILAQSDLKKQKITPYIGFHAVLLNLN